MSTHGARRGSPHGGWALPLPVSRRSRNMHRVSSFDWFWSINIVVHQPEKTAIQHRFLPDCEVGEDFDVIGKFATLCHFSTQNDGLPGSACIRGAWRVPITLKASRLRMAGENGETETWSELCCGVILARHLALASLWLLQCRLPSVKSVISESLLKSCYFWGWLRMWMFQIGCISTALARE